MKFAYLGVIFAIFGIGIIVAGCSDETTGTSTGNAGNGGNSGSSSSGDGGSGGTIADAGTDAAEYQCGVGPGTMGNSKGVGKYCDSIADCSGQEASICAVLGDPTAHFCTKVCSASMPSDVQCGENADCSCNGGPCGCTPASCGGSPDGGSPDGG